MVERGKECTTSTAAKQAAKGKEKKEKKEKKKTDSKPSTLTKPAEQEIAARKAEDEMQEDKAAQKRVEKVIQNKKRRSGKEQDELSKTLKASEEKIFKENITNMFNLKTQKRAPLEYDVWLEQEKKMAEVARKAAEEAELSGSNPINKQKLKTYLL